MNNRRTFIKQLLAGSASLLAMPGMAMGGKAEKITILHTNDLHSRI